MENPGFLDPLCLVVRMSWTCSSQAHWEGCADFKSSCADFKSSCAVLSEIGPPGIRQILGNQHLVLPLGGSNGTLLWRELMEAGCIISFFTEYK